MNLITGIALDEKRVSHIDEEGRLRVDITPISKACVSGYYGRELAGGEDLIPDKLYMILRHPEALKKSIESFKRVPLLSQHVDYTPDSNYEQFVIGCLGDDVQFDGTYLQASMSVWDGDSIRKIQSGEVRELSAGYKYELNMTPGVFDGEQYDGIMTDIIGNHVMLTPRGRAGRDVYVHDSQPTEESDAMDEFEKLMRPMCGDEVDMEELKQKLIEHIKSDRAKWGELGLDEKEVDGGEYVEKIEYPDGEKKEFEHKGEEELIKDKKLAGDSMAFDYDAMASKIEQAVSKKYADLRQAERDCRAIIGDTAYESADEIYRAALSNLGVRDVKSIHSSALKPMVDVLRGNKARQTAGDSVANDSISRVNAFLLGE